MKQTVIFLLAFASAWAPLRAQQAELDINPVLFTVMAAINAAGYDTELDSPNTLPVRRQVRQFLAEKKPASLDGIRDFYAAHRKENAASDLAQYISLALCLEIYPSADGPDFRYRLRAADLPPDVAELDGIEVLLTQFYRETKLGEILAANREQFDRVLEPYAAPVTLGLQEIDAYLRLPRLNDPKGRFHVFLDLLGAPNQIHVRSYGNDFYIVVTPSAEPQLEYIRNAYLRYQLDPLVMRHFVEVEKKRSLIDFAQGAGALSSQYKNDFSLLLIASLGKAIEARLAPAREREKRIAEATKEGYILTPYFAERLPEYEKQEQAIRYYLADMISGIDLKAETARLDKVEFYPEPKTRLAKVAPAAPVVKSPAEATLEEAETFYGQKDYPRAGELYRRALTETNARALKAKAYYGLARLAALSNDPETALELFEKTIAEGAEPQVAAWAHVFLGRLHDLAQEPEAARKNFTAARDLAGASPAARKAAEDGLKGVRPTKP
ncbi:MAG: tetratricopeptide repeat protein [Bryobacter sp.]|nr:tetratricopeptide repeat protein [Bryobacter sp.]